MNAEKNTDATLQFEEIRNFEKMIHKIFPKSKFLRAWNLKGGFTTQMTAFEILTADGQKKKMVKRENEGESHAYKLGVDIENEFKLLGILHADGYAVPEPYYLDQSNEIFPYTYLISEFIEGKAIITPSDVEGYFFSLAETLANIHLHDISNLNLDFIPQQNEIFSALMKKRINLDERLNEQIIKKTLQAVWPLPQQNKSVLLHGDFWPGNIIWEDNKPSAVIDWELTSIGDPLFDLSTARIELLLLFGEDAMNEFTACYTSIMNTLDLSNLPYWDLYLAFFRPSSMLSEWFSSSSYPLETVREKHKWFSEQALEKIST